MATPAAIGVYLTRGARPEHVTSRAWRGVYCHHGGEPDFLGNELLDEVRRLRGDLDSFVERVITAAPFGCSWLGDPYSEDGGEAPVTPDDLRRVAYCHVLDIEARRLDVFDARSGARIFSATIDATGRPTPRFFGLDEAEERSDGDDPIAPPIALAELERIFGEILPLRAGQFAIELRTCRQDEAGALLVTTLVYGYDQSGTLRGIAEREAYLALPDTPRDRARVEAYLLAWRDALFDRLPKTPSLETGSWMSPELLSAYLFHPNALRRALTRDQKRFFELLTSPRYLGYLTAP